MDGVGDFVAACGVVVNIASSYWNSTPESYRIGVYPWRIGVELFVAGCSLHAPC